MRIEIINEADRRTVAGILVANGYTVSMHREKRSKNGRYIWYLVAESNGEDTNCIAKETN